MVATATSCGRRPAMSSVGRSGTHPLPLTARCASGTQRRADEQAGVNGLAGGGWSGGRRAAGRCSARSIRIKSVRGGYRLLHRSCGTSSADIQSRELYRAQIVLYE